MGGFLLGAGATRESPHRPRLPWLATRTPAGPPGRAVASVHEGRERLDVAAVSVAEMPLALARGVAAVEAHVVAGAGVAARRALLDAEAAARQAGVEFADEVDVRGALLGDDYRAGGP